MNTRTGELKWLDELTAEKDEWIEVNNDEITEKQKQKRQVSKHDNKSILGKKFLRFREERKNLYKGKVKSTGRNKA